MARQDTLETRFTASIVQFENELRRLQRLNSQAANKLAADQARAAKQAEAAWSKTNIGKAMSRQMADATAVIKNYATVIAGAFAGREALNAAEEWTAFTNTLKVAGKAGGDLAASQERLMGIANKAGVDIGTLGTLYGRLTQSQRELGATNEQVMRFTNGVATALKVQGGSAEAASGALLQLSQGLGAGIIRAEEWNSILEGAKPILDAVAAGWGKNGTSIAKLRAEMLAGKLTSSAFFEAMLNGSDVLEAKAAKSTMTVGQAMIVLRNNLAQYIGQTDQSLGITQRMAEGISMLANNIGTVTNALLILGGAYAATYIPALARASAAGATFVAGTIASTAASARDTVALISRTAALYGVSRATATAAVAARGLQAALAFFGGPIGIAITAISVALGYFAVSSLKAAAAAEELGRAIDARAQSLEQARVASIASRGEHGLLTSAEKQAAIEAAKLTGEQDKLKNKYYEVAAAAKAARLEQARADTSAAVREYNQAATAARGVRDTAAGRARRNGYMFTGPGAPPVQLNSETDIRRAGQDALRNSPEYRQFLKARQNLQGTRAAEQAIRDEKLDPKPYIPTPPVVTPKPSGGKKTKTPKVNDISSASEDEVMRAEQAYRQALWAQAETLDQRHAAMLEQIEFERANAVEQVQQNIKDKKITAAKGQEAIALINQTAEVRRTTASREYQRERVDQANRLLAEEIEMQNDRLKLMADAEQDLADHSKTLKASQAHEREALRLRQQADADAFKVQQDQLALDRERLGLTADEIARLRAIAEGNFRTGQQQERDRLGRKQEDDTRKANPSIRDQIKDQAESFGTLNTQLGNIAKDGLNSLTSGLTDAIMGTQSLKEAFTDMAKSIISQLIEMAIRFAIFEAIGMALGVPGLGKASIGLGDVKKNAMGTNFFPGGLSLVGEKGPELAYLPRGSQVVPNNLLRNAMSADGHRGGGGQSIVLNTTVNAKDAVLTDKVHEWIYTAQVQAIQHSQKMTMQAIAKRQKNSLLR